MRALLTDDGGAAAPPGSSSASAPASWPRRIDTGWRLVSTAAGACASPAELPRDEPGSHWLDAPVPGTVASAWRANGRLDIERAPAFAFDDHWYRVQIEGHGAHRLRLSGLATLCEVWLDGVRLLDSDSMFVAHDVDIVLNGTSTLVLCFRSIAPLLAARRPRPRWRPRLVTPPTLRNVRTTLLGYMPGWCPTLQAVGPWRPVELLGGSPQAFDRVDLATRVVDDDGIVSLTLTFLHPQPPEVPASLRCAGARAPLAWRDPHTLAGELFVPHVERWWPHTHGTPALHGVALELDGVTVDLGRVGFRTVEVEADAADARGDVTGFALRINGTPVFCRGACWTSADLVTLAGTPDQLAHAFSLARQAGMNMLRVGGTMVYESDTFYALADEFGILIWQDFAFANFDYPHDEAFRVSVTAEATQFLARTRRHPSLAVLCGGSEVEQQAAMFGLPPALRVQPLFTEWLPSIITRERPDVPYVVNSPSGGVWPFSTRNGVTHYYGVGAYQRPVSDVRRAAVRFAGECLAFANVPDDATLHLALGTTQTHNPRWKAAVPRDPGAGWDFEDVRDYYVDSVYGMNPQRLRYEDPQRYLDLSRAVVADLMTDVFAEWRRTGSPCGGALVWQFQDLRPGAGWGIVDATGRPKSAWYALARVLQPVQLVITDEGLDGLDVHVVNETAESVQAELELVCLRDGALRVAGATTSVDLAPRSTLRLNAAEWLGQFFDFTYAYRFGPRAHDTTIVTLRERNTGIVLSEATHLPDPRAVERHDVGLGATLQQDGSDWQLVVKARRFARFVHIEDPRYRPADNWFHLGPNQSRTIALLPFNTDDTDSGPAGEVRAINAIAPVLYG